MTARDQTEADIRLATPSGTFRSVARSDLRSWSRDLVGDVITPADPAYDAARSVWNGTVDVRPALIVRCEGEEDVAQAVRFAAEREAVTSVRGGGHNVAGTAVCEAGVVLDLSRMRDVEVDPDAGIVKVEGGATLGDLDQATYPHGLAVPTGFVSQTGVAGLALKGGLGHRMRAQGLTCDNIVGVELVTSDGEVRHVDDAADPDLMWALRGGPEDLGVVTRFEFQAHEVPNEVRLLMAAFPAEHGPRINRLMDQILREAPPELGLISFYATLPDAPELPSEARDREVIVLFGMHPGPPAEASDQLAPILQHPGLIADLGDWMPYTDAQSVLDEEYPDGMRYYWKSLYLDELTDEVLAVLHRLGRDRPSAESTLDVWGLGGAVTSTDPHRSAFPKRDAAYMVAIEANWQHPEDDQRNIAWARRATETLEPYSNGGFYMNFAGAREEQDEAGRRLYDDVAARIDAVRSRVDPVGLFGHR